MDEISKRAIKQIEQELMELLSDAAQQHNTEVAPNPAPVTANRDKLLWAIPIAAITLIAAALTPNTKPESTAAQAAAQLQHDATARPAGIDLYKPLDPLPPTKL